MLQRFLCILTLGLCLSMPALAEQPSDYTGLERVGLMGLNLLFGTGSYLAGHTWDGILLTTWEVCGISLLAMPFIMQTDDPDIVTLDIAMGTAFLVLDVLFSVIYPLGYHKALPQGLALGTSLGLSRNRTLSATLKICVSF